MGFEGSRGSAPALSWLVANRRFKPVRVLEIVSQSEAEVPLQGTEHMLQFPRAIALGYDERGFQPDIASYENSIHLSYM